MSYALLKKILFTLEPEKAHRLSLVILNCLYATKLLSLFSRPIQSQPIKVMGLTFPNRIGLAAGLDKNAEYCSALAALGFGFVEVGTVTPKPQAGNPKPRLFRLSQEHGLLNAMGFNNHGVDYLIHCLGQHNVPVPLGINIGKNKITSNQEAPTDYLTCMQKVYPFADYITINLSSPNTPGLRDLQHGEALTHLLTRLKAEQQTLADQHQRHVPLVLKISPDLAATQLRLLAKQIVNTQIEGVIATNTVAVQGFYHDPDIKKIAERELGMAGGVSGRPIFPQSLAAVGVLAEALEGQVPIIACGGIDSPSRAQQMLQAGASLIQLYTGLIYQGPYLLETLIQATVEPA